MNNIVALQPALATGSIEAYIHAVNEIPMLSAEEEQDLARRLRDSHDLDAARQLVMSHLRFVVRVARGYRGYGLPLADLIQEGTIGLMKAVKRFNPELGCAPGFLCGSLDPRGNARIHPAQLAHSQSRNDQGTAQTVL